jgi:hypothetical protein
MASVSHEPAGYAPGRPEWAEFLRIREMWAAVAISTMWLAVLFDAVFGPNFVGTGNDGSSATIPSAIFVAFFAFLATASVAKRAFGQAVTNAG